MRHTIAVALAALLLAASAAPAEEIDFGWFGTVEYDDNIFNAQDNEEDDLIFRTGPVLGVRRTQGDVTYEGRYELRWESFLDQTGLDAFDHTALGKARWQITPRTYVSVQDRFLLTRSLNRSTFLVDPGAPTEVPVTDIEVARQRIKQNTAALTLGHQITPRLSATGNLSHYLFRTNADNRVDNNSLTGGGDLIYTLTERDQVGGGSSVTWQDYEASDTFPGSNTYIYRIFGIWYHTFDPTLSLRLRAGPSWYDTDESSQPTSVVERQFPFENTGSGLRTYNSATCPTDNGFPYFNAEICDLFPGEVQGAPAQFIRNLPLVLLPVVDEGEQAGSQLTYYASVELSKRWEQWEASLSYLRDASTSSGLGQSTILDAVTGQLIWSPSPLWEVRMVGQWTNRTSATDQLAVVAGLGAPEVLLIATPAGIFPVPASRTINGRLIESDDFIDVQTYQAVLRIKRRIGRRSEVYTRFVYLNQDFDSDAGTRKFDNFRVLFGFRWMFDPLNV